MRRKKTRSPAQRAATARMLAANKAARTPRALKRRRKTAKRAQTVRRQLAKNPVQRGAFQIAVLRLGNVRYLAGVGLSSNRETAAHYSTIGAARSAAKQIRPLIGRAGIEKVAVVTAHDSPGAIRSFLLGEA